MTGEEGEVVPSPAVEVVVEVLRDVDEVEGQPAEDEDHQDGHEQSAPPPVPGPLLPPPGQGLAERVSGGPLGQPTDDLEVGDGADDDREEELGGEEEDSVDSPPGLGPLLVAVGDV